MTKILLICHDIPSMTVGATLPIYHLIRKLGLKYDIDLISFDSKKYTLKSIQNQLHNYDTIEIPEYLSIKEQFLYTFKNMLSFDNIHTRSFLNYYYNSNMNHLIQKSIEENEYDIIITDMPMAFYVKNISLPKIVYAFDAVSNYNYNMYKQADSITSRIYWYLNYLKINRYEKTYNKFNLCIVVNKKDKLLLKKDITTQIEVIANGVDTEFFKNNENITKDKLVFLGDMSTPPNNDAVKYFVDNIYPLILEEKNIDFYIVGRNPSNYIKTLAKNPHITVTGSVDDVRVYLEHGTIFITPMISGTGIKNKILEAMSMKLPVISTSIGISGINAIDKIHYLKADTAIEFKKAVNELIEDKNLRNKITANAYNLVEKEYSWDNSMEKLDDMIKQQLSNK